MPGPILPLRSSLAPAHSHTSPPACTLAPILPLRSSLAPSRRSLTDKPTRPTPAFFLCAAPSLPCPRSFTHQPARSLPFSLCVAPSLPRPRSLTYPLARSLPCSLCVAPSIPPAPLTHTHARPFARSLQYISALCSSLARSHPLNKSFAQPPAQSLMRSSLAPSHPLNPDPILHPRSSLAPSPTLIHTTRPPARSLAPTLPLRNTLARSTTRPPARPSSLRVAPSLNRLPSITRPPARPPAKALPSSLRVAPPLPRLPSIKYTPARLLEPSHSPSA